MTMRRRRPKRERESTYRTYKLPQIVKTLRTQQVCRGLAAGYSEVEIAMIIGVTRQMVGVVERRTRPLLDGLGFVTFEQMALCMGHRMYLPWGSWSVQWQPPSDEPLIEARVLEGLAFLKSRRLPMNRKYALPVVDGHSIIQPRFWAARGVGDHVTSNLDPMDVVGSAEEMGVILREVTHIDGERIEGPPVYEVVESPPIADRAYMLFGFDASTTVHAAMLAEALRLPEGELIDAVRGDARFKVSLGPNRREMIGDEIVTRQRASVRLVGSAEVSR